MNGAPLLPLATPEQRAEKWRIRFLLLLIGLSAFPMTESILLQTATFTECIGFGHEFYGVAVLVLFLPGLAIQVLQNRMDRSYDINCLIRHGRGTLNH